MKNKTVCRKCDSTNVWFTKHIHEGKIQGKTFHYKLWCVNCGAVYNTPRTKDVYEAVKDQQWIQGKKESKRILKEWHRERKKAKKPYISIDLQKQQAMF